MTTSERSYLTAGIAAFGAGAIALAPVVPVGTDPAQLPHRIPQLAVGLTAAVTPVDPIQNIINIITASGDNLGTLVNDWASGLYVDGTFPFPPNTVVNGNLGWRTGGYASGVPFPVISQIVSNLITYVGELPDIGTIINQAFGNITSALGAPFAAGVEEEGRALGFIPNSPYNQNVNADPYLNIFGLDASQRDLWALLPFLLTDTPEVYDQLKPILDAASTPISGLLIGAIGPIVAPVLAVVNGLSNTFALLQESDFGGAITELINIPANAIGALLNGGQILDLTPVLSLAGITLPETITSIGLQMGGLLSPGGVAFDALAAEAAVGGETVTISGLPVGPIGALVSLTNYVAKSIVVTPPAVEEVIVVDTDPSEPVLETDPSGVVLEAAEALQAAAAAPEPADTVASESVPREPVTADPATESVAANTEAAVAAELTDVRAQTAASEDTADREAPRATRSVRGPGASSAVDAGAPGPKRAARSAAARTR